MKKILILLLAACVATLPAMAQLPGLGDSLPTSAPGADFATYAQLFGKTAAFTARSDVRMLDKNQKESMSAGMDFAMLDSKLRLELDATKTKNRNQPSATADQFKEMGMDQVVIIVRPDQEKVHFVFPKAKMSINMPMEKSDLVKAEKSKVSVERVGEETLDGHPCVKSKVFITSAEGEKQEMTVWRASDLKDFPIQTIQKQNEDTVVTRYSKIQFVKPDAKQFEPPAGVEEFEGMADFVQGMMKKMISGSLPGGK